MSLHLDQEFPHGLLRPELFLGVASAISAQSIGVNLSAAGHASGSHYAGARYGRGEVGEFVLIEGQQSLLLGRISEVRLREKERREIRPSYQGKDELDAVGTVQLLGCVSMHDLRVTAGVDAYPRLGDRIYAAPHRFIALLPVLMERKGGEGTVSLEIGHVDAAGESVVSVRPEKLFGRHCAILGATGGGKSWTTARIVGECLRYKSKIILIDATGEYRSFSGEHVENCHLGTPLHIATGSEECSVPPECFIESDFIALFEPSGKVQGPKLKAAIESLRLAKIDPKLANDKGLIVKARMDKRPIQRALYKYAKSIQNPSQPFDVELLPMQVVEECVQDYEHDKWGGRSEQEVGYCAALIARINGVLRSPSLSCVFSRSGLHSFSDKMNGFIESDKRLFRLCLSGVGYEYKAREIVANVIGRLLLNSARIGRFLTSPTVVIVDEAHNFLGRQHGTEDFQNKLDAFEIISKEGRKYGLNICLATQRPRDITDGVLSQIGTLIVHRLTNDRDREVVERACGEIDRAASAFLPNLRPGEAAIIGTDFPIPLTVQIAKPTIRPQSDGPDFQSCWKQTPIGETPAIPPINAPAQTADKVRAKAHKKGTEDTSPKTPEQ